MSPTELPTTRVALAHDSLDQLGGAERVVQQFQKMFPHAPLYVLVANEGVSAHFNEPIKTSRLQRLYAFLPKLRYLLPFIPGAVSALDFSGYDLVLSSSSSFIKNISVPSGTLHVCYCHTPTRFLWTDLGYADQEVPWFLKTLRPALNRTLEFMRTWDMQGAQRVGVFIANSKEVQKRIQTVYHRDSEVVYPPVDTDFWHSTKERGHHWLLAGRLQAHKSPDFAVRLFTELGLPLHVVGEGRALHQLKKLAGPTITFLGRVSDEVLRDEYSSARALIYPQHEDAGLVPIEAAACGTPTLALGSGGALETVVAGTTGEFFYSHDLTEAAAQVLGWDDAQYRRTTLASHAEQFSASNFQLHMRSVLSRALAQHQETRP